MPVFKDFPGLENLEKNSRTFKDPQELCPLIRSDLDYGHTTYMAWDGSIQLASLPFSFRIKYKRNTPRS